MATEDPSDGLYIHRSTPDWPHGTRTMTVQVGDGETTEWVAAADFMAVQKERDDYRRALALINVWRWSPDFINQRTELLDTVLRKAALTPDDAHAMHGIIASVRSDAATQNPDTEEPR